MKEIFIGTFRGKEMVLKVHQEDTFDYRGAFDSYIGALENSNKERMNREIDADFKKKYLKKTFWEKIFG